VGRKAYSYCFLGVNLSSRQHQVHRPVSPHDVRKKSDAERRNDTVPELGREKSRTLTSDDEVAGKSKLQPTTCSAALHRCNRDVVFPTEKACVSREPVTCAFACVLWDSSSAIFIGLLAGTAASTNN
jgi:hypothetical protein